MPKRQHSDEPEEKHRRRVPPRDRPAPQLGHGHAADESQDSGYGGASSPVKVYGDERAASPTSYREEQEQEREREGHAEPSPAQQSDTNRRAFPGAVQDSPLPRRASEELLATLFTRPDPHRKRKLTGRCLITISDPTTNETVGKAPWSDFVEFLKKSHLITATPIAPQVNSSLEVSVLSKANPSQASAPPATRDDRLVFRAFPRDDGMITVRPYTPAAPARPFFLRLHLAEKRLERISFDDYMHEVGMTPPPATTMVLAFPRDLYPPVHFGVRNDEVFPDTDLELWLKGIVRFHFYGSNGSGKCTCSTGFHHWVFPAGRDGRPGALTFRRPSEIWRHLAHPRHSFLQSLNFLCQVLQEWNPNSHTARGAAAGH